MHPPEAHRVDLDAPRGLSAVERALVDFLVDGADARGTLRAQAATARVAAVCSCGCPSVWLDVDAPAAHLPDQPRWTSVTGYAGEAEVTLHIIEGRLHELEIWAGEHGVRPVVDLAALRYERA